MPERSGIDPPAMIREFEDPDAIAIMAAHRAGKQKMRAGLADFLEVGRRLIRKKAEITGGKYRGGWGNWIRANVDFGWTQTCRYMNFARDVEKRFGPEFSPGENSDVDEISRLWDATRSKPADENVDANSAYHEAGQAVIAYVGGAKIEQVTIDPLISNNVDRRIPTSGQVSYEERENDPLWV